MQLTSATTDGDKPTPVRLVTLSNLKVDQKYDGSIFYNRNYRTWEIRRR